MIRRSEKYENLHDIQDRKVLIREAVKSLELL